MSKLNALFVSYAKEDEAILQPFLTDMQALKGLFPDLAVASQRHYGNEKLAFQENSLVLHACSTLVLVVSENYLSDSFYRSSIRNALPEQNQTKNIYFLVAEPVDLSKEPFFKKIHKNYSFSIVGSPEGPNDFEANCAELQRQFKNYLAASNSVKAKSNGINLSKYSEKIGHLLTSFGALIFDVIQREKPIFGSRANTSQPSLSNAYGSVYEGQENFSQEEALPNSPVTNSSEDRKEVDQVNTEG